jgi:uncharacterized RDD family membrane protein YckC
VATLVVETPEGVELKLELAGAGSRFAAALIDMLWFLTAAGALGLVVIGLAVALPTSVGGFLGGVYVGGVLLLIIAFPFVLHVRMAGASPGKRLLGLRVTAADGSPARPLQHLLRALILPVDLLPTGILLGLLLVGVTPRATRLGDLAAGTVVLRVRKGAPPVRASGGARWQADPAAAPLLGPDSAARLAPADFDFLRELRDREHVAPEARDLLERQAASAYARRLGFPEPRSPEGVRAALAAVLALDVAHGAEPG